MQSQTTPLTSQKQQQSKPLVTNQQQTAKDTIKKLQFIEQMMRQTKDGKDTRKYKYYQDLLKKHNFWDNRPMLRDDKDQVEYGSIEQGRKVEDVSKDPEPLPDKTLLWCDIDVRNDVQLSQVYNLIAYNFVQDDKSMFRFDYSRGFLRWVLTPPGFQPKWHVGIRNANKQLVACIMGVPVHTCVENDKIKMAQVDFLCIHKAYRTKKLTTLLFNEITRRVNLKDKWQAIFGAGKNVPTPFCRASYYQRPLNPKKLMEINFSSLANQNQALAIKLFSLPEEPTINLRQMTKKDVFGVYELVNQGLSKFLVKFHFTQEDIKHYFLPQDKIIYTYVIEKVQNIQGKKKSKITDVLSFYSLPYIMVNGPKDMTIYACYSFYNFATSVSMEQLIRNALICAKKEGFDVYNNLNLMDNASVYENLHFNVADGNLNYYLYNWVMKSRKIQPSQLGIVLF